MIGAPLMDAVVRFTTEHGKKPRFVYLGEIELQRVRQHAKVFDTHFAPNGSDEADTICGMEIVEVKRDSFLKVGL